MNVSCPRCGSKQLRQATILDFSERVMSWLGRPPIRCRNCDLRFREAVWRFRDLFYARCPRCYRLDLTTWDEKHYFATGWTAFWLGLGARRRRCEVCRVNFASFRPIKHRFHFRRRRRKAERNCSTA